METVHFPLSICPTKIVLAIPESNYANCLSAKNRRVTATQKATYAAGCFWTVEPDCETEWKEG